MGIKWLPIFVQCRLRSLLDLLRLRRRLSSICLVGDSLSKEGKHMGMLGLGLAG